MFSVEFLEELDMYMNFHPSERGQGLFEYALAIVLVAVIVMILLIVLGEAVTNLFDQVVSAI